MCREDIVEVEDLLNSELELDVLRSDNENEVEGDLKGNLRSKKKLSSNERAVKNAKRRAITDLNAPNGSRDIPFQSQEFEQYGCRHFLHF